MRPRISDLVWLPLALLLAAAVLVLLLSIEPDQGAGAQPIALSDLAFAIKRSAIRSIHIDGDHGVAIDRLGVPHRFEVDPNTTVLHSLVAFGVSPEELADIDYSVPDPPAAATWWQAIANLAPMVLVGTLLLLVAGAGAESNQQQLMQFTRHRARSFVPTRQCVSFADVAGVDEAKQDLQEIVKFLAEPRAFAEVGARCPHGVLLVGPPGTGKTLLARAVAGEARVPFSSICGSEFVEILAGLGASRVRDLFDHARRSAPCILFVDEIDAIGRRRGLGVGAGTSECEQALNQLLVEMDGFESRGNIVVLAATNRVDILDPALLRAGRFDRQVVVARPDRAGRQAILAVHARGKPLDATVDLGLVAHLTAGLSGADLAQIMNESAILAVRRRKRQIGISEVNAAIERLLIGPETIGRVIPVSLRTRRAYHEAGRATTIHFLEHHPPVHRVTIVPHTAAQSFTRCLDHEERACMTYAELQDQLTAALAGPAAERLRFPEVSSGDESDIRAATALAEAMVKRYGMSRRLGPVALSSQPSRDYSDSTARLVDDEIRALIDRANTLAVRILRAHRAGLDRLAARLLVEETVEGDALDEILTPNAA